MQNNNLMSNEDRAYYNEIRKKYTWVPDNFSLLKKKFVPRKKYKKFNKGA